jgi:hypothetical protein
MSTKTTFKRIALVTVAALGFGLLTSVSPASADDVEATTAKVTAVTIAAVGTGRVGSVFTSQVGFTTASSIADDDFTFRARFDEKPATSTVAVGFNATGLDIATTSDEAAVIYAAGAAGNELLPATLKINATTGAAGAQTAVAGRVGFVPDVVGSYVVTVWHDADRDGLVGSAEAKATRTFTVGSAVASVKVTSLSGTALATANSGNGALVKLELLDAAGAAAGLASNEAIRLSPSTSTMDITLANGVAVGHTAGASSYVDLVAANFTKGVSYVNLTDSAASTVTVSIAGQGGSVTGVVGTFTQKFVVSDVTGNTATTILTTGGTTAAAYGTTSTIGVAGDITGITIPNGSKTLTYRTTLTAGVATTTTDAYLSATITDNSGYVTGAAVQGITTDLVWDKALLLTESTTTAGTFTTSVAVTTSAPAAEQQFVIAVAEGDGADTSSTVTSTATVTTSSGLVSVSPSSALALKIAGSVTYNVTVKDNFGRVLPNASVKMVITGRNANQTVTPPTSTTSSTGVATFTLTDAPVAGTTTLTDSIVFTAVGYDGTSKASTAVTITWSATGPVVSTVTLTTGTEDDTASSITYRDIAAGATGAQAGAATITATVKDSAGNLLAGVPVAFTTASAGAAVVSTSATKYTAADGTVTASVYGWTSGTKTFTATAGTATGSGTVNYKQTTATDVRTIAAKVEGSIVTVTASDRFGNTVEGVKIYGTKTGTGYFGNGSSTSSATTDKNGVAEFVVQGTGSFKFAAGDATAADLEYGDTDAAAGKVGTTAVTATTVGTATTDETGVGASFAPAGVNSVTLDISVANASEAAADAAAEATDAANAATDAANAAAEAADAATAAAQDAADAVAALSTQVSEMVNALKKQITALTNLVIKIQKKVKA